MIAPLWEIRWQKMRPWPDDRPYGRLHIHRYNTKAIALNYILAVQSYWHQRGVDIEWWLDEIYG